jgi:hypothetical protein
MVIDLSVLGRIVEAAVLVVLGIFINRWFERRPRLVAYYGHVGAFQLQPSGQYPGGGVNTHSIVIQNTGKLAAHNVRLPHRIALKPPPLNFSVEPPTDFTRTPLAGGGEEITFPVLVPGQQVTISYLYFPPLTWDLINVRISSDEGMARVLNVLPTPQLPRWRLRIFQFLMFIGVVTLVYLVVELALWIKAQGFL